MGFLYHGYKPKYYFWEFLIIYRKTIIILIIVFEAHIDKIIQGLLIIIILFYSFILQIQQKPFVTCDLNRIEK